MGQAGDNIRETIGGAKDDFENDRPGLDADIRRSASRLSRGVASVELPNWWEVHSFTAGEVKVPSTKRGRAQDRARVAGGQDHEVCHEAKKEGVSKDAVKGAVKDVGNSRTKVEGDLEKKR